MTDFLRYQRIITIICVAVCVLAAAGLYVFLPDQWQYAAGALIGGFGGIIQLRIKVLAILSVIHDDSSEGPKPVRSMLRYNLLGYFIAGGTLFTAYSIGGYPMIWSAIGGLLLPNVVLGLDGFLRPAPQPAAPESAKEGTA